MQPLVLLDTNVLIHIARADPVGTWVVENYRLARHTERPLISTVVEAEVRALAAYQGWGERKLDRVRDIIGECVRVEIDRPPVVDAYVDLYCIARSEGRANWQKNQNDLWLAATAKATDAMLLTQDEDFDFLHPEHVRIERVPKEVP
ncbi:MAG: type II toxin-antitoxin system VapC family toxin [Armatimonadota bacterium]